MEREREREREREPTMTLTLGSKNTTGSLLRMELSSSPLAQRGPRGITTTMPGVCAR